MELRTKIIIGGIIILITIIICILIYNYLQPDFTKPKEYIKCDFPLSDHIMELYHKQKDCTELIFKKENVELKPYTLEFDIEYTGTPDILSQIISCVYINNDTNEWMGLSSIGYGFNEESIDKLSVKTNLDSVRIILDCQDNYIKMKIVRLWENTQIYCNFKLTKTDDIIEEHPTNNYTFFLNVYKNKNIKLSRISVKFQ